MGCQEVAPQVWGGQGGAFKDLGAHVTPGKLLSALAQPQLKVLPDLWVPWQVHVVWFDTLWILPLNGWLGFWFTIYESIILGESVTVSLEKVTPEVGSGHIAERRCLGTDFTLHYFLSILPWSDIEIFPSINVLLWTCAFIYFLWSRFIALGSQICSLEPFWVD